MLKKELFFVFLTAGALVLGIMFFLLQRGFLVIHWADRIEFSGQLFINQQQSVTHKTCSYFMWKNKKMMHEQGEILWHKDNGAANCQSLLNGWLITLQDNRLINRSVQLMSVAMSSFDEQAYIVFSRSLFLPDWSIEQKWRVMEGLLKTIRNAGIKTQEVFILVDDDYLDDDHLDFSQGWPIDGFEHV